MSKSNIFVKNNRTPQTLASICFALKDTKKGLSNDFWAKSRILLEKNKDQFDDQNKELVEFAVRDNPNLKQLEKHFKPKDQ